MLVREFENLVGAFITMNQEQILFNKSINRVNFFLKLAGIFINYDDEHRNLFQRLYNRWFFCLNVLWKETDSLGFFGMTSQLSIPEITYMVPCITLCFLGECKSFYFIREHHHVVDLIRSLRRLQGMGRTCGEVEKEMTQRIVPFLSKTNTALLVMGAGAVLTFCAGPAVFLAHHYATSGEWRRVLPFSVWYPFDAYDYRVWPFVWMHQNWTAIVSFFCVFGPDCFYYTCCAFVHVQMRALRQDVRHVAHAIARGRGEFVSVVERHRELIRCVALLEQIYEKSTLFNVLCSSLILCLTGFNILAIDDLMLMVPFTPFLLLGSIQIFLFCFYGDLIMQDFMDISEAVYDTEWYNLDAAGMKYCLIMITRSQKPCKITAYGFTDINMRGFSAILSSSWSYFTLLKTMYGNDKK